MADEEAPSEQATERVARQGWNGEALSAHVVDVFVYVMVLNLAAQFAPRIITETFSVSVLVAIVLKLVLDAVLVVKGWAKRRFRSASSRRGRAVGAVTLLLVLPGSKIAVLELVGFLFPDSVELGGFFAVTGLILVLLAARFAMRGLLRL